MKATEWKWYQPDLRPCLRQAGQQSWDHGGYECGIDSTETVCIIAPDGTETRWIIRHEATVNHYVEACQ